MVEPLFQQKNRSNNFSNNKIGRPASPTKELVNELLQQQVNYNFELNFILFRCRRATVQEKYDKNFK
ncbi:unnamed protein product [Rotaria magnacalcarata]|uniref:Uncharacterized protein n=1 Tax=Rotaria magnacalcarata TaxID=392030 RepID=A0A820PE57_9BILA|nr:unnamed protein product [Rotaria magnacalcarata]CAF3883769.1 unnamed protein product [Rotaria magnacalcarata]CAF3913902.1 unnamed protein product [Rotaria magnacalcarata]CAF4405152.1 unnamed protein product [Rotaria magnacalcarata]